MNTTCTIKLPSWTRVGRINSDQLPPGSKYPIAYADAEYLQWRGGRMTTQFTDGYHFLMELREWDLDKALELEIEIKSPVTLLFYAFKGYLNCLHQQSKTRISLLPGQYGMINLTAGDYTVTVRKGQTITFLFQIDPQFLDWLRFHHKGFSILADYSQNSLTFFKFPFCNIDFTVGRIIRQLRILNDLQQPTSPALSEKLVTLLMQYQKQLVNLKDERQETAVEKIERIKSFIAQEISKNPLPPIPEISRMFGIGHRTLRRLFKNQTDISLNDYMYRARMEEGLKQLKTKASVTEVSQYLGYGSVAAFSKSFTRYHGFPPENIKKN